MPITFIQRLYKGLNVISYKFRVRQQNEENSKKFWESNQGFHTLWIILNADCRLFLSLFSFYQTAHKSKHICMAAGQSFRPPDDEKPPFKWKMWSAAKVKLFIK